jgi:hypothetical protein
MPEISKVKIPYSEKTDAEKVRTNWRKTLKLYSQGEYSVCIIRAATSAELMVNLALRHELISARSLPKPFVDQLMRKANGIVGKFFGLLLPILDGDRKQGQVRALGKDLEALNDQRNRVVHQGEFKKRSTAYESMQLAHKFITQLQIYDATVSIDLPEPPTEEASARR